MHRLCRTNFALMFGSLLCAAGSLLWAESGVLVVHVKDVQQRPIRGIQIGVEGDGGSSTTGDDGKARIALAKDTKEKSWVSLQILKSPPGKDFVMVSPWDHRSVVASFENESENFVEVVVVQRGDRAALESGSVLAAATAQINKANAPKTADRPSLQEDPKANLATIAERYGLAPYDLDQAIRAWGAKATDAYDVGLAALYEGNYARASAQIADSLQHREERLASDQKAVADAAFFLGLSLSEEGKYRDSANAYQRCLQLRPSDTTTMSNLGASLMEAGEFGSADRLFRQALALDETAPGAGNPILAIDLNNLAALLLTEGNYAEAEPLFRRSLAIREKAPGADSNPALATALNNLATIVLNKGDAAEAERLFRRSLATNEKALGPDHPRVADSLGNLAGILKNKGDYACAERLFRRALAIDEKALGPDHPDVAVMLNNLAGLLRDKGDVTAAAPLFRRALAIAEKSFGSNHPITQHIRRNLEALRSAGSTQKPEK
jgi:tetratricopeptide (TPR) repeat protein